MITLLFVLSSLAQAYVYHQPDQAYKVEPWGNEHQHQHHHHHHHHAEASRLDQFVSILERNAPAPVHDAGLGAPASAPVPARVGKATAAATTGRKRKASAKQEARQEARQVGAKCQP